ncbi:MAG: hypothetical protein AAF799_21435 [Myxococcota bacterium]
MSLVTQLLAAHPAPLPHEHGEIPWMALAVMGLIGLAAGVILARRSRSALQARNGDIQDAA